MKEKIKEFYKIIKYLNYKINPGIMASSLTFYLLITIIPVLILITEILNILDIKAVFSISVNYNIGITFVMLINLVWSSSKIIHILSIISDIIYFDVKVRPRIKLRIKSFLLSFIYLLLVILIIVVFVYLSFIKYQLNFMPKIILDVIQFITLYFMVSLFIAYLYKKIVPTISFIKETFNISLLITLTLFIMTIAYQLIIKEILIKSYLELYGELASFIVLIFWIYCNCYVFVVGISVILIKRCIKENRLHIIYSDMKEV